MWVHDYIVFVLMANLAFTVANLTGIWGFDAFRYDIYGADVAAQKIDKLRKTFEGQASMFDYLQMGAFIITHGILTILMFVVGVPFAAPKVLAAFYIPQPLASLLGNMVTLSVLLGLGYMLLGRRG